MDPRFSTNQGFRAHMLPQRDKQALKNLARAEGEPLPVVVRRILRAKLRRRGLLKSDDTRMTRETG